MTNILQDKMHFVKGNEILNIEIAVKMPIIDEKHNWTCNFAISGNGLIQKDIFGASFL